jgi:hypothetical protein
MSSTPEDASQIPLSPTPRPRGVIMPVRSRNQRANDRLIVLYLPHMAPKKTTLKEIGEMLAHVVKQMATKDDLAAAETRLDRRIDKLDAKIDSVESNLAGK